MKTFFTTLLLVLIPLLIEAKLPDIGPHETRLKIDEIMKYHVLYKTLDLEVVKRALNNFLEELDPVKTYFVQGDIERWTNPSDELLRKVMEEYKKDNFQEFEAIYAQMLQAIARRHALDRAVDQAALPTHVSAEEFKDMPWAKDDQDLLERLRKIKGLQLEAATKLKPEQKEKSFQRISKKQAKYEEELLTTDSAKRKQLVLSKVIKAFASSLDTHTSYFTPDEAEQFMINVQQRLFGIGAQLRDDINGFTIVKIVEGGPAANNKLLKVKDRIIAVDGEPIVGMEITDAVELIRGEENTPVTLTIIREEDEGGIKEDVTHDITLLRGEVVIKESRYEVTHEPFGSGVIAYLRLYSFYQDPESSSSSDLEKEFKKIQAEHKVLGVILDLRYNAGGLLTQAVEVAGLFITKGVVVSIKDENGSIQHLRDVDGKTIWNGPLIVLINRGSASASEIVAQTLQDYGRALIVGDDHSFGKGSFQTFTLNTGRKASINTQGEYKVTRGLYYTVSGKSPQKLGVLSDIIIPGPLTESEIGEEYSKFPIPSDTIPASFNDDLSDVPLFERAKIASLYKFNLQRKLDTYKPYIAVLKSNSTERIQNNKNYQNFLKELKKKDKAKDVESENQDLFGQNDLQLTEAINIMKDLILFMNITGAKAA
jgi:carboxyl-terminal processing protease